MTPDSNNCKASPCQRGEDVFYNTRSQIPRQTPKYYVRDHLILRTEAATNNVTDYGVNKAVENLPALRGKLAAIDDNYLDIQQDILETFVDNGLIHRPAGLYLRVLIHPQSGELNPE